MMAGGLLYSSDKVLPANQLAYSLVGIAVVRGADQHKLLRGTGIFSEDLTSDKSISCLQLQRLISNAKQLTEGYDLAFRFGHQMIATFVNDALPFFTYTRDVAEVIRTLPLFSTRIFPLISACRYQDTEATWFVLQDSMGSGKLFPFLAEAYFAAFSALLRHCVGSRVPLEFSFPFAKPKRIEEYEAGLGFRLRFNQPFFAVRIAQSSLTMPCLHPNRVLKYSALKRHKANRKYKMALLDAVRFHLTKQDTPSLVMVAQALDCSPASLKRKLAQHNTSFSLLYDDVRRQKAIFLLSIQKLNNEQSALKMAFSDITNFRRAVKRWTGYTPSQLRAN